MRMIDDCRYHLVKAGISMPDADALRRISMTLHRWHELECGDGNNYGSWVITRGYKSASALDFTYADGGKPYLEHHHYTHGAGKDSISYTAMPDRERGALKRLDAIMAKYPGFVSYVQGDPRGCALYILRPEDIPEKLYRKLPDGSMIRDVDAVSSCYTRGIAVHK